MVYAVVVNNIMKYIAKVKITTVIYVEFNITDANNEDEAWDIAKRQHSQRLDEADYFREQEVTDVVIDE